jgi:hypothetical protein
MTSHDLDETTPKAPTSSDISDFHGLIDMEEPDLDAITTMARQFRTWIRDGIITVLTAYSSDVNSMNEIRDSNTLFLTREALRHPRLKELGIDTSISGHTE